MAATRTRTCRMFRPAHAKLTSLLSTIQNATGPITARSSALRFCLIAPSLLMEAAAVMVGLLFEVEFAQMKITIPFLTMILLGVVFLLLSPGQTPVAQAGSDKMILTAIDFEAGVSYRSVQSHAPIGLIPHHCSYPPKFFFPILFSYSGGG